MAAPVDALLLAAQRAHASGDIDAAVAAFQQALQHQKNDPKILFLLGNVLLESGQFSAALQSLEQAAAQQRNHPAIAGSLAQAYFEAGRYAEAEKSFRKACRLDPRAPHFQIGLANTLALQQQFAEAETLLQRVVQRFPDNAYAWMNLGNVARDQARPDAAIDHYREALRCDARLLDARNNLGSALHSMLRFEEAEQAYRACIALDPGFVLARSNLASVLIDLGRFAEAEAQCRDMLGIAPAFADAHAMLAAALGSQGRLTEALPHFRQAANLSPETQRYTTALASALCETGQIDEGLQAFGAALLQSAEPLAVTQMVTPVLLSHGYFSEGWSRYRQRQGYLRIREQFQRLQLQQSLAPVASRGLAGLHIGVVCEQGLGDELFFLRFVPQLKALGVCITYCTSPKLQSMLQRVAAIDAIVNSPDDLPPTDLNMLVGDLPHALCEFHAAAAGDADAAADPALLAAFPWTCPPHAPLPPRSVQIAPLPDAVAKVQKSLASAGPPPYLAITWRGGTAPEKQRGVEWKLFKEIDITPLGRALAAWPGTVLALQRHPAAGEVAALQTALGRPLADFTAVNDDLEQMLALLSVIDEYVAVSNTNVHLRAAAEQCARVLVPCPAEWRWMAEGASPWFPGTRVYRQSLDGRWDEALTALRRDLTKA